MWLLADVSVGFCRGTEVVGLRSGRELTVVRIVLAGALVEVLAEDDVSRRGPVPVPTVVGLSAVLVAATTSSTAAATPPVAVTSGTETAAAMVTVVVWTEPAPVKWAAELSASRVATASAAAASPGFVLLVLGRGLGGGGVRRDEGAGGLALEVGAEFLFQGACCEKRFFPLLRCGVHAQSIIDEFY
jgi:hypothetical protein